MILTHLLRVLAQIMEEQKLDVLAALAQRRHNERKIVDAIEEVLEECTIVALGQQVRLSTRKSHAHRRQRGRSNPPSSLCCCRETAAACPAWSERSYRSRREKSCRRRPHAGDRSLSAVRAGEGALGRDRKARFEQRLRHRGAVHMDKTLVAAVTQQVRRIRDQALCLSRSHPAAAPSRSSARRAQPG